MSLVSTAQGFVERVETDGKDLLWDTARRAKSFQLWMPLIDKRSLSFKEFALLRGFVSTSECTVDMSKDLEDVCLTTSRIFPSDLMTDDSITAGGVSAPWKHPNPANRYTKSFRSLIPSYRLIKALKAADELVGYSTSQHALFKTGQLTPIKDLKLLVKDYAVCET
jgi:hypothetical protein